MKWKPMTGIIAAAVLTASGAVAEDKETVLSNVVSPVLINQGEAYVEAQEGMLLQPGDQLMVMKGGSAQVNLAVGCSAQLEPNTITRITPDMNCDSFSTAGTYNAVGGSGGGGGGGFGTGDWVALGLTVVVGGVAISEMDSSSSSNRSAEVN